MTDLKSAIMLVHIVGLAFGLGGAWIIDIFLTKYLIKQNITLEKVQFIEYASKIVCYGLALLWASGVGFVTYYYHFSPEYLANEKVWAKAFIVLILTINGVFVHLYVLPIIRLCVGSSLLPMVSRSVAHKLTTVCVVSVLSWIFPLLLGVSKSLNFSVSAFDILAVYVAVVVVSLVIGHLMVTFILQRITPKEPIEIVHLMFETDQFSIKKIQKNLKKLTGTAHSNSELEAMISARHSSKSNQERNSLPSFRPITSST